MLGPLSVGVSRWTGLQVDVGGCCTACCPAGYGDDVSSRVPKVRPFLSSRVQKLAARDKAGMACNINGPDIQSQS